MLALVLMLCGWSEDIKVEILPVFRMSSAQNATEGKAATEGKSETLPQQGGGVVTRLLLPSKQPRC